MFALSVIRLIEVIGEAAKNVSDESTRNNSQIPWKQIAGTRDRLIHGYFDVDHDVVWQIISVDLPSLVEELEIMLP